AFYREHGMAWPPKRDASPEVSVDGMTDRFAEITCFANHVFAAPGPTAPWFFDANPTLKRLMIQGPDNKYKSVWHDHPMCMTGESRVILRSTKRVGNAHVRQVRLLNLTECFAMTGTGGLL
ncbi:MAG: hypothetical protein ACKPKO_47955, partial [Candidatus Fonsibacter sp.]